MARPKKRQDTTADNIGQTDIVKQLWQAAVNLQGSIEPSDYKRPFEGA